MTDSLLRITRGADLTLAAAFKNADGSAIDMTGFTIVATIASRGKSVALTVSNRSDAAGTCTLSLTETQTAALAAGKIGRLTIAYTSSAAQTVKDDIGIEVV